MLRADHTIMSRMMRMDGRIGKIHSFWAMYSLRMSAWTVPESRFRSQPRLCASATYIASRIQAVGLMVMDTEIFSRSTPAKRASDVVERVHGDALAPDLAQRARVVGVVAHEGRHVEVHAEPRLALLDEVAEAAVGVLARAEARDLAHGPEPPAVHRRIRPARVRVLARQPEVLLAEVLDVFGRVDALERQAGQRPVLACGTPAGARGTRAARPPPTPRAARRPARSRRGRTLRPPSSRARRR